MFIIMNKIFSLIVFLFLFETTLCFSQVNDAGLWASINLEKKINPKLAIALTEEARFNENISELGSAFTELGANYKIKKNILIGVSYRFIQRRGVDDFYSLRHRYMIDLTIKHKIKKVSFALRERFQSQYADVNTSENGRLSERTLRNKLTVKYDLDKKYTPYISAELFYQLNNVMGNEFDNIRYAVGFEYKFNKTSSLDLFYLINKEMNINDPVTDYVIGMGYNYTF